VHLRCTPLKSGGGGTPVELFLAGLREWDDQFRKKLVNFAAEPACPEARRDWTGSLESKTRLPIVLHAAGTNVEGGLAVDHQVVVGIRAPAGAQLAIEAGAHQRPVAAEAQAVNGKGRAASHLAESRLEPGARFEELVQPERADFRRY
jgi:hypothetical protein